MENLMIEYDGLPVPVKLCTVDRLGGADDCDGCEDYCTNNCKECAIQECFTKLFEYESAGLTPEQLKEIDKLYLEKCEELNKFAFTQKYPIGCTLLNKNDDEPGECTVIGYQVMENAAYIILDDFTKVDTKMVERLFKVKEEGIKK